MGGVSLNTENKRKYTQSQNVGITVRRPVCVSARERNKVLYLGLLVDRVAPTMFVGGVEAFFLGPSQNPPRDSNIGADVWGESSIMTGVYQRWCSSTLHIGWGLCDRVCQVIVCRGRYGLGGWVFASFWD